MSNNYSNDDNDELFMKMMGCKVDDKSDKNDKNDEKEQNEINKLLKSGFDYYKILGIDNNSDNSEIKKKYRTLLAKYHPDKLKSLPEESRKKKAEQFKLIKMAGDVLTNPEKRKYYDLEQKVIKSKNFQSQKSGFDDFIKLQEADITEETKGKAKLDFERENQKINKLRGFDPSDKSVMDKIDKKEFNKNYDDLMARRDIQNIELTQKNLFENRNFSPEEFNKMFERDKKRRDKIIKKKQEKGEIVKFNEGFTAFNDVNANFVSVETDYSELFADNTDGNNLFSNVTTGLSDDNLSDINYSDDEYDYKNDYDNHKLNKADTNDVYSRFMEQRKKDDFNYNNMKNNEFMDVMNDNFGISKDFGRVLGKDNFNTTIKSNKRLDTNTINAYNRLIKHDNNSDSD
jgi:curved DNA-binding protein CbpA